MFTQIDHDLTSRFQLDERIQAFDARLRPAITAGVDTLYDRLTGKTPCEVLKIAAHEACSLYLDAEAAKSHGDIVVIAAAEAALAAKVSEVLTLQATISAA